MCFLVIFFSQDFAHSSICPFIHSSLHPFIIGVISISNTLVTVFSLAKFILLQKNTTTPLLPSTPLGREFYPTLEPQTAFSETTNSDAPLAEFGQTSMALLDPVSLSASQALLVA